MTDALKLLIAERDRLNKAIAVLQGEAPRRGRPSGNGKKAAKPLAKRTFSPEDRQKQSEKMKAYWAARRKAAQKTAKKSSK